MEADRETSACFEGKIQAWGNSMGLRIPKRVGEAVGLDRGVVVEMELVDGALLVRPKAPALRRWTEDELLAGLSPHTAHADELPRLLDHEYPD